MRDELLIARGGGDFSFSLNKEKSVDLSEQRVQSFILHDKSNSELKNSCSSRYVDYLDHFKKSFLQLIREDEENDSEQDSGDDEEDEGGGLILDQNWKSSGTKPGTGTKNNSTQNLNQSNILLNSTILSNCFNNNSFNHNPNISKEVDFTEEDPLDDSCSFLSKIKGEPIK